MEQLTLLNLAFLIIFPVVAALALLVLRNDKARGGAVVVMAVAIMIASVAFALPYLGGQEAWLALDIEWIAYVALAIDMLCCLYVIVKGVQHKRFLAVALAVIQAAIVLCFEFLFAHNVHVAANIHVDSFAAIMVLVIGIIGSGICIYANGYMRDFQKHETEHGNSDRRPVFFALMFVFLSAMFIIVLSNDLTWLLTGWEVTTVCSFALIGYTRTEEAINNSFRQISMNLLGGIAFSLALVVLASGFYGSHPILELDELIKTNGSGFYTLPVMLLALAAFTKAAQMPFQTWLLGAMVAPTPTSALLHSSTMVKAGVFLLIKLSPCFGWNFNGITVALVGGITFLACSCIAISQSNAKRVLAYSTIANLGLIVACAGVGTPESVWAAIFLLIFHAAAKSLLFLCVGTTEHHIGSRDIEDMDDLFDRLPRIARFTALGILCMFIAPFGMLISKWATLVSLADTGHLVLIVILAFGSAATFMFWAKWLGKILAVAQGNADAEKGVHGSEWFSLGLMATLALGLSITFPLVSQLVVMPYLEQIFSLAPGAASTVSFDNLALMAVIALVLFAGFIIQFIRPAKPSNASIYMAGVGLENSVAGSSDDAAPGTGIRSYRNSLSGESLATQRNWYLKSVFGEGILTMPAYVISIALLVFGLGTALLVSMGIVQIGGIL